MVDLKSYIREVPDFPTPGVSFKDIGPILASPQHFQKAINGMTVGLCMLSDKGASKIVAIESRGFPLGGTIAYKMCVGLVLARKKGKLPGKTVIASYALEYGSASLEIQDSVISKGDRVWVVDDVLATGGTAFATAELVCQLGGVVDGFAFLLELSFLHGREKLKGYDVFSLMSFDT